MKIILLFIACVMSADNGSCPAADQFCLKCTSTNCALCAYSALTSGKCVAPTTKVTGCLEYSAAGACTNCD